MSDPVGLIPARPLPGRAVVGVDSLNAYYGLRSIQCAER